MYRTFVIVRHTFREAVVQPIYTLLLALAAGILLATGNDESPSQPAGEPGVVEPVPDASTPEERARNLAEWLRENSG